MSFGDYILYNSSGTGTYTNELITTKIGSTYYTASNRRSSYNNYRGRYVYMNEGSGGYYYYKTHTTSSTELTQTSVSYSSPKYLITGYNDVMVGIIKSSTDNKYGIYSYRLNSDGTLTYLSFCDFNNSDDVSSNSYNIYPLSNGQILTFGESSSSVTYQYNIVNITSSSGTMSRAIGSSIQFPGTPVFNSDSTDNVFVINSNKIIVNTSKGACLLTKSSTSSSLTCTNIIFGSDSPDSSQYKNIFYIDPGTEVAIKYRSTENANEMAFDFYHLREFDDKAYFDYQSTSLVQNFSMNGEDTRVGNMGFFTQAGSYLAGLISVNRLSSSSSSENYNALRKIIIFSFKGQSGKIIYDGYQNILNSATNSNYGTPHYPAGIWNRQGNYMIESDGYTHELFKLKTTPYGRAINDGKFGDKVAIVKY